MEDVRTEFRAWLEAHWNPELSLREWRELLVESRWAAPSWPTEFYGRGLEAEADSVVSKELQRVGAPGTPTGVSMALAAPTLLQYASDELKKKLLRPILTGEHTWCQLFSEPGSGSDLAGLTSHAVRSGDEWIVNGQKVWNTSAHHADYGLLVARTDWDVAKHAGITYFALPMRQPGISVRPLRQANGYSSFNEVFMDDARVPADHVVGELNNGWSIATFTLAVERRNFATFAQRPAITGDGRAIKEAKAEADEYFSSYIWYPQRTGRVDLLIERAKAAGRDTDPVVRQKVAKVLSMHRVMQWTAQRAAIARAQGKPPGPEGSIAKIMASEVARAAAECHSLIAGPSGLIAGEDGPAGGLITEVLISVPAISIAGGTDEIQRNIIGERVLGLPREPEPHKELPFREVPRGSR
jgi:alkylation response protein AidB-like acyl-CoA dehydrogenase